MLLLPLFLLLPTTKTLATRFAAISRNEPIIRPWLLSSPFSLFQSIFRPFAFFLFSSLFPSDSTVCNERVHSVAASKRGNYTGQGVPRCRPGKVTVTFSYRATVNLLDLLQLARSLTQRAPIVQPPRH